MPSSRTIPLLLSILAGLLFAVPAHSKPVRETAAAPGAPLQKGKPGKKGEQEKEKKRKGEARPGAPSGVRRGGPDAGDEPGAAATIRAHVNARGQTVFSIAPVRFDVSPPLRELATREMPHLEEEEESPTNPLLPAWRIPRSGLPDPVVQSEIGFGASLRQPIALQVPTTGFDFLGVVQSGAVPPDTNGAVGNDQYVETVNTRYQVWSLDRGTKAATPLLGPALINTLWAGFGGACQTQNAGDPIVLFDRLANRWLISQFTTGISGGFYFQCVALSTTADATGTYARWAFAVPNGIFGDYPHFGVWTDAYYMMAHGFTSSGAGGSYLAGIFAAMDRPKMLAGDPTATWQVILDPDEGGHMPADQDGPTPPPTRAPGIFLSLHGPSMYFYRMKVDFAVPANTTRILQGTAPVAPATGACILFADPGTCIPQPGTTTQLDSLGDRLMFRAAYRKFVDHESIVISHSVDPFVTGLVAGVRWYDFRLSGGPDPACPSYPCTWQQGTIADVVNGRNRWMPSIAMDGAENILVGYSVSGKTHLAENHSIRYTGRAKNDPPGLMTVPEVTVATGVRNNINNSRWGDYTSMSVDPFDDCTFWHANEYYFTANNSWATRIASAAWPAGTGDGQCQPISCSSRPASAPLIGAAIVPGQNQIQVSWNAIAPPAGSYAIERAVGACGSEGIYQPLGFVGGASTIFTDTTVQGGITYSYRVIAAADGAGKCQALVASGCASTTATGTCNLKPDFDGAADATSAAASICGINLSWGAGSSSCPLTPNVRYNVYRGTVPDFVPSAANRVAACADGPDSYLDQANLASGVTYYYVVRAEDDSTGNGGPCGGGNEEANGIVVNGTAYGAGLQPAPGTWADNGGDGTSLLRRNAPGEGNSPEPAWRFVKTANDPGANHTTGGAYAYRNAGPAAGDAYLPLICAEMRTPPIPVGASSVNLTYWERHQLEYHWDGVVVEFSLNDGAWTTVPAPSNSILAGCSATAAVTNWETLSCTGAPPANSCGYPATQSAINGPLGGGVDCNTWSTSGAVTAYANRCHPLTGLSPGDTIQFRWRFTSDPAAEFAGFYLNDVEITNVLLPNACVPGVGCGGQPDGTACDDANPCTAGTTCTSGACGGGAPVQPPEINDSVAFGADGETLSWDDPPGAYNVYRGLRTSPWTYDQTCLQPHVAGSSVSDAAEPAPGQIFFYLVTRLDACGESTPGQDSSGTPRPNPAPCP
ncbi:MAG TPA: hypothetical protein VFD06_12965 [Candidatus Polarisedimenticolia bacterium]|nr:hypothetical protein [Candidatus Polarisedimenticolia bacterium]